MEPDTTKLFYEDHYRKEFEAKVLEVGDNKVVLDQTCFYPEGGGQVGDTGVIGDIKVTDTIKEGVKMIEKGDKVIPTGGKIIHILESPPNFSVGDSVEGHIDWDRRYKIMRLHSASHIMEHFLFKVFGKMELSGTNVDDRKDRSTYLSEESLDPEKLIEVEKLCNDFISEGHDIKTWPSDEDENLRIWQCEDIKMYCGGTHVNNTKEIGKIKLKRKSAGAGKEKVETTLSD